MLNDFLEWWWGTLSACALTMRRSVASPTGSRITLRKSVLEFGGTGQPVIVPNNAGVLADQDMLGRIRSETAATRVLALEFGRYVLRALSPARLPASRARAMMPFDLAAATPFAGDDVHCFMLRPLDRAASAATTYAIIRRNVLDPPLHALASARLPPTAIVLLPASEDEAPRWELSRADIARLNGIPPPRKKASAAVAMLIVAAAGGTLAHVKWNYANAQARAEENLPALEVKAKSIREELNRRAELVAEVATLRRNLATQRPMSEVWEELSRVLPDTAYVTDLTVKSGSALLVGFSRSASSIMAPLEDSPLLEGPEFVSPVVRVPGIDGERFEVKLNVLSR